MLWFQPGGLRLRPVPSSIPKKKKKEISLHVVLYSIVDNDANDVDIGSTSLGIPMQSRSRFRRERAFTSPCNEERRGLVRAWKRSSGSYDRKEQLP